MNIPPFKLRDEPGFTINLASLMPNPIIKGTKLVPNRRNKTIEDTPMNLHIKSTYNLGYVIGAYLSIGWSYIRQDSRGFYSGAAEWYVGDLNGLYTLDLMDSIDDTFGITPSVRIRGRVYEVRVFRLAVANFFSMFGVKETRRIPDEFLVNNKDYLEGIRDGLDDFHGAVKDTRKLRNNNTRVISDSNVDLYNFLHKIID